MLRHGVKAVFGYDVPVTMMMGIKNTVGQEYTRIAHG